MSNATLPPGATQEALHNALAVAEYQTIRNEILWLEDVQARLVYVAVIAFGAVLSVGFQTDNSLIIMVYPVLAFILAVNWIQHAHSMQRCGRYIRSLELRLLGPHFGWETFLMTERMPAQWLGFWGPRTIFSVSAVLALGGSMLIEVPRGANIAFLIVSAAITLATVLVTALWRERKGHARTELVPAVPTQ